MKKFILVVVLAVGLQAGNIACSHYINQMGKYLKLAGMAHDRGDSSDFRRYSEKSLYAMEHLLVECPEDMEMRDQIEGLRKRTVEFLKQ